VFVVYSKYIHMLPDAYSASESPYKDVHVSLENLQSTFFFWWGGGKLINVSFSLYCTTSHEGRGTVPYICDCVRMSSRPKMILNKVLDLVECSLFSTFFTPASTACGARNAKLKIH